MRYLATITCALVLLVAGCGGSDDKKKTSSTSDQAAAQETALLRDMETFLPTDINRQDKTIKIDQAICKKRSASNYRCTLYRRNTTVLKATVTVKPNGTYTYDAQPVRG